jgi:hypothetical protein
MMLQSGHRILSSLIAASTLALAATDAVADAFVDIGASASELEAKVANQEAKIETSSSSVHVGVGVQRRLSGGNDIGVRLELDEVDSELLLALRLVDYRFNVSERLAFGAFFGAARLSLGTPAYGYYLGGGVQLKQLVAKWDLGVDLRYGDKIARDNLLPTDPQGGSQDNFYDLTGVSVYLSRRF